MSTSVRITDYAQQRFFEDTKEHRLDVLHEDGLYRHLRFKKPDTIIFYFDIVTWPGHLAVTGDAGDFVFARIKDMVDFFMGDQGQRLRINPHYWSEKLIAPRGRSGALEFSQRVYAQGIREWAADEIASEGRTRELVDEILLSSLPTNGEEAHDRIDRFNEHEFAPRIEHWDWDFRDYRFDFLWCCWAIVWGLRKYEERGSD